LEKFHDDTINLKLSALAVRLGHNKRFKFKAKIDSEDFQAK
jgi:hypothetical protein